MIATDEVTRYINRFDGECQNRLKQMRACITDVAPDAVECISYGMPGYKLNGKPLVYFAGYEGHVGFYATPNGHEAFAQDFAQYKHRKGSVQFPHDKPLPLDVVRRVVKFRVANVGKEF
ncbi:DUF1801 domain-containing protein [Candidatus Saccharibacteria bacterium]|nr:DUF1801 domain-containing protein [Candidatus Saccharibacteria bacterium]